MKRRFERTRVRAVGLRVAALGCALAVLGVACAPNGGDDMDDSLTQALAQDRTNEILGRSVSILPAGSRLDVANPNFPQGTLPRGGYEPCYSDNVTVDGPHRFQAGYWVIDGSTARGDLDLLIASWKEWGWTVEDDSLDGGNTVRVDTPDGYKLLAVLSRKGTQSLSLSGSSPCFAIEAGVQPPDGVAATTIEQR